MLSGRSEPAVARPNHLQLQNSLSCSDQQGRTISRLSLDDLYERARQTPSDINEHCETLRALAAQCKHVTEFGMRHGVSTVALLSGQPKRLVTYDLQDDPVSQVLARFRGQTDFEFRCGDSLRIEIEETDLLFIDTIHTAEQLWGELTRHAAKVRRWIVLHDTETFGEVGEAGGDGLLTALKQFLAEETLWSVVYHIRANNGLTIIARCGRGASVEYRPLEAADERGPAQIWM